MPACIILLNGYPGVGKLTIAKELSQILPDCKVFDNHLLIDVAAALHTRSDPGYYPLRKQLRQTVFQSVIDTITSSPRTSNQTYIFTENQSTNPAGRAVLSEYLDFIQSAPSTYLIHFVLSCDTETNVTRLSSSERSKTEKSKLVDTGILRDIRMTEEVGFMFPCSRPDLLPERLKGEFEIATTDLKPVESAALIAEYVMDCMRREGWYIRLKRV